jgi:hypothetical protein
VKKLSRAEVHTIIDPTRLKTRSLKSCRQESSCAICSQCYSGLSGHDSGFSPLGSQRNRQDSKKVSVEGRQEINGGHCLVTWHKVCQPPERARWTWRCRSPKDGMGPQDALLWLEKTVSYRPWCPFLVQVHPYVSSFSMTVCTAIGDGAQIFWTDRWIHALQEIL